MGNLRNVILIVATLAPSAFPGADTNEFPGVTKSMFAAEYGLVTRPVYGSGQSQLLESR